MDPSFQSTTFMLHIFRDAFSRPIYSAGKCPAPPAAPLPGNFSQIFLQEISYFLQEISVKIVPAKTEVYHHHKQNQTFLKSIYIVGRTFYSFLFLILLPGREIYFLGLPIYTIRFVVYDCHSDVWQRVVMPHFLLILHWRNLKRNICSTRVYSITYARVRIVYKTNRIA